MLITLSPSVLPSFFRLPYLSRCQEIQPSTCAAHSFRVVFEKSDFNSSCCPVLFVPLLFLRNKYRTRLHPEGAQRLFLLQILNLQSSIKNFKLFVFFSFRGSNATPSFPARAVGSLTWYHPMAGQSSSLQLYSGATVLKTSKWSFLNNEKYLECHHPHFNRILHRYRITTQPSPGFNPSRHANWLCLASIQNW